MCAIIDKMGEDELKKFCDKGEKHGMGSLMKDIWDTNLTWQRKEFTQNQASNSKLLVMYQELMELDYN